jgi:hypothetical protein
MEIVAPAVCAAMTYGQAQFHIAQSGQQERAEIKLSSQRADG